MSDPNMKTSLKATVIIVVLLFIGVLCCAAFLEKRPYRIAVAEGEHTNLPVRMTQDEQSLITARMVHSKLISSLSQKCEAKCTVVDLTLNSDAQYDAELTGTWVKQPGWPSVNYQTMMAAMRLVARDGTVRWSDTFQITVDTNTSLPSAFADETAKRLVASLK